MYSSCIFLIILQFYNLRLGISLFYYLYIYFVVLYIYYFLWSSHPFYDSLSKRINSENWMCIPSTYNKGTLSIGHRCSVYFSLSLLILSVFPSWILFALFLNHRESVPQSVGNCGWNDRVRSESIFETGKSSIWITVWCHLGFCIRKKALSFLIVFLEILIRSPFDTTYL